MFKSTDTDLFEKAIKKVNPTGETLNSNTVDFFHKYEIPEDLQIFLKINAFDRAFEVGHLHFGRTNDIRIVNLDEQNISCIKEGFLIIGNWFNGDPIVVDLKTLTVGFVFHDYLWEGDFEKVKDIYIGTGLSIGQFYFNVLNQMEIFPADAYEAKKRYHTKEN
jgi:hypothetical protein